MFDVPDAPWIGKCKEDYYEREVVYTCANCGEDICDGEDYYEIAGDCYCEECVKQRTAEA